MTDPHNHGPLKKTATTRLWISVGLTAFIFVLELVGGWLSNSLSLLSDAGHVFTDVMASGLILLSIWWAAKPPSARNTYGHYRAEILATLINGGLLLFIAFQILLAAWHRLFTTEVIRTGVMLPIAIAGLVGNGISVVLLHNDREHLATRSAYFHVLSDTISSIGVVLAGFAIAKTGWTILDPLMAFAIAGLILFGGYRLVKEAVSILMEASPAHVKLEAVERQILSVPGVEAVHDLHVWTISSGYLSASAHIQVHPMDTRASDAIVRGVSTRLSEEYGITHATLQVETLPTS
ncbi:MAG: cation diffusion facilitator family transporter [Pseudomonadota bacterium]